MKNQQVLGSMPSCLCRAWILIMLTCVALLYAGPAYSQNTSETSRIPRGNAGAKDDAAVSTLDVDVWNGNDVLRDEILVGFHAGVPAADRAGIRRGLGAEEVKAFPRIDCHRWRLPRGAGLAQAIGQLARNPRVRYAEPNYVYQANDNIPDDTLFEHLWGMQNLGQTGGTPGADISAAQAWNTTTGQPTGAEEIVVAVIDTGVDYNHPDLAANMWVNPKETPNGKDDDGNGFIDDIHGADFFNNDGDPMDDSDHGTHVSGTIGAVGNNNLGVAGVSWNVKIMALKFLGPGGGSTDDAVSAIFYAIDNGAKLTSNSWGGGGESQALEDAIQASADAGMLFIAAAGNANRDNDGRFANYPSNYEVPNIIAVAATDHDDEKATFSSYGATSVDIGAPGVDILSTVRNGAYDWFSGTSMATPHVAGVAALAWNLAPEASYAQIRDAIYAGGDEVDSMAGITVTGKRLNAFNTLPQVAFVVTGSEPVPSSTTSASLTEFQIRFSHPVDTDTGSLQASDLAVNGITADTFAYDASTQTATFFFTTSPVMNEGSQFMSVDAGAISTTSSGLPGGSTIAEWSGVFRYDTVVLDIIGWSPNPVTTLPLTSLSLDLNEAVDPATVDSTDFILSQGTVVGATVNEPDNNQITLQLEDVSEEGELTIALRAGALADPHGNPNAAWSTTFSNLDYGVFPLAVDSLTPIDPVGSWLYTKDLAGNIGPSGDEDQFVIEIDPWQTVTVLVEPSSTLVASASISDADNPDAGNLESASGTLPGEKIQVPIVSNPGPHPMTFTVTISGMSGSTGSYEATILLNGMLDVELGQAPEGDDLVPQDLAPGFVSVAASANADRAAVIGSINDRYSTAIVIEDFEDGNLDEYSEQKGNSQSNTSVTTAAAHDGQYGLQDETNSGEKGWIYRDDNEVRVGHGDVISVWVRSEGTNGRAYFGFGASSKGTYSMVMAANTNQLILMYNNGYRYEDLAVVPQMWQPDHWYRFEVDWQSTGDITARVYDSDGETLLNSITANHSAISSGGLAFRAFDSTKHFDTVAKSAFEAADVDLYAFDLDAGERVAVALTALTNGAASVELLDAAGNVMAQGMGGFTNVDQTIADFVAPSGGTFYARVTGDNRLKYSLVVTRNAAFDLEGNDDFASAQDLTGPTAVLGSIVNKVAPGFDVIEGFEGDLSAYTELDVSNASITAAAAHDGATGLQDETNSGFSGWIYRDDPSVHLERGDTFSVWVRSDGDPTGRAYFGFGASDQGAYTVIMAPNSGSLDLNVNAGYGFSTLGSVPQNWLPDHWYRLEVEWHENGDIIGNLYDSDGTTLLNSVAGHDTLFAGGGIAFRAFGSTKHFDTVQRAVPNPDIYRVPLDKGDMITFATSLPAGESGAFLNLLDPQINLYGPYGLLVATNDNRDATTLNALVDYTAVVAGDHFVEVGASETSAPSSGEYILAYSLTEAPPSPGITLTPSGGLVTTEGGGTDSFTVVLDTEPAGTVTITLESDDLSEGFVSPEMLTFDSIDWDVPQTVTVTGVDDAEEDGSIAYNIVVTSSSADLDYHALEQFVSVTNHDNDAASTPMLSVADTVSYSTSGGKGGTKHLDITLTVSETDSGALFEGATLTAQFLLDGSSLGTASGVTASTGEVTFTIKNASSGFYETNVESVTADGFTWDGVQPSTNTFVKQ